jgi:hypothetical protein
MSVVECDVPRHSALGEDLIERADFRDAHCAPLSRSDLSVIEIFFAFLRGRLDESDADCAQQGRSTSWPGGANYGGIMKMERKTATLSVKRSDHGQSFFSARTNSLRTEVSRSISDLRPGMMRAV